jgi:spore germination protein GerM
MKKVFLVIVVLICVLAAWQLWHRLHQEPEVAPAVETAVKSRVVTLYFGSRDGNSLVPESRELGIRGSSAADLRLLIEALISGPDGEGVATLPPATRLIGAYIQGRTAYLDFSRDIIDPSTGGTAGEYLMIASLVNTVCANFEDIDAVEILLEGEEVDSIGGHLLISGPLRPQDWR